MTMKLIVRAASCAALAFSIPAVEAADTVPAAATNAVGKVRRQRTPQELNAMRKASLMRHHGGYVRKANSAKGKVVFLNAQKLIPRADFTCALEEIDERIHPIWEMKDVASVKLVNPAADIKAAGGEIGVVLVESADLPALVVAPEAGWAEVNVTALTNYCDGAKTLATRANKELLRAFALVGGGAFMTRDPIVMRADIRQPQELDLIGYPEYGIDVADAMQRKLPLVGVKPWIQETYRTACREGWAHSPTNEFQKKIWDKVHELPTKPLKLEK